MVYIFGINIPILELLVIFSVIVVLYLIILELEFRHIRRVRKKLDQHEKEFYKENKTLAREIKELKTEIISLKNVLQKLHVPRAGRGK